jgi:hypothetical protein
MGRMTGAPCTTVAETLPEGVLVPCRMHVGNAAASAGGKMRRTSPAKLSGLYVVGGRALLGVVSALIYELNSVRSVPELWTWRMLYRSLYLASGFRYALAAFASLLLGLYWPTGLPTDVRPCMHTL